jgi:uncharacterized membrane protein YfcA
VVTAPALLLGNAHRLWLFRRHLRARVAGALVAGALPGALVGGLAAVAMPLWAIHALMVLATLLAIGRTVQKRYMMAGARAAARGAPVWLLAPLGFGIGAFCATSSGGALLVSPILLAAGLAGDAYIATAASVMASMHLGRLSGYGMGGEVAAGDVGAALLLGACILVGNTLGERVRRRLSPTASTWIEHATLVACVGLALLGIGRR